MGYRLYFYKIPKAELKEIKQCKTNEEFCAWAENKGYETKIYRLGKEVYEFGKDVDWAFEMQSKNESIFGSKELEEYYEDYQPVICSKDDFLFVINVYKQKIIDYYKNLLDENSESFFLRGKTPEERYKCHIEKQLNEWENPFGCCPLNTDLSTERINNSWLYEYAIFELVRVYKTFDWENDALILLGW